MGQRTRGTDRPRPDAGFYPREPLGGETRTSTPPARSPSRPASRCSLRDARRQQRGLGSTKIIGLLRLRWPYRRFVAIELRSRSPLIPFRIFRIRTLTGANVVGILLGASLFSMFYFISLYMQQVLGYSPIHAGLSYLPLAVTIIIAAGFGGQLVTRFGFKPILAAWCCSRQEGSCTFGRIATGRELPRRHPRSLATGGDRPRDSAS